MRRSVRPSVDSSVGPSLGPSVTLIFQMRENASIRLSRPAGIAHGKWKCLEVMRGAGKGVTREGAIRDGMSEEMRGMHLTAVYPALFDQFLRP